MNATYEFRQALPYARFYSLPKVLPVIVCHCKVVNDQAVTRAVDAGARTVSQVCHATGAGRDCGSCVFTLKRLLCEHEGRAGDTLMEVEGAAS
jgi:bacterioferritin-associated ferredoxin